MKPRKMKPRTKEFETLLLAYIVFVLIVLLVGLSGCKSVKSSTKKEETKTEIKAETKTETKTDVKVDSSGVKTTEEEDEMITYITEYHPDTAAKTGIVRVTAIRQKGSRKTVENAAKKIEGKTEIRQIEKVEFGQKMSTKTKAKEKKLPIALVLAMILFLFLLFLLIRFTYKFLKN